jgi:hypothetical protein
MCAISAGVTVGTIDPAALGLAPSRRDLAGAMRPQRRLLRALLDGERGRRDAVTLNGWRSSPRLADDLPAGLTLATTRSTTAAHDSLDRLVEFTNA